MATGALLGSWLEFSRDNTNLQQFGQADDESTFNGATGCTHTILQRLVKAKTEKHYSHDQISKIASYPWPNQNRGMRGMRSGGTDNEAGRVINYFDLPYRIVFDLSFGQLADAAARGPVMVGVLYGYWPEDRGYVYGGVKADGKPGGFAVRNGKTQLRGAEGVYHATLWLGTANVNGTYTAYANEPNHRSPSRPERPDYDTITGAQLRRAYEQYGSRGRRLMAWVPTKTFKPKGY